MLLLIFSIILTSEQQLGGARLSPSPQGDISFCGIPTSTFTHFYVDSVQIADKM